MFLVYSFFYKRFFMLLLIIFLIVCFVGIPFCWYLLLKNADEEELKYIESYNKYRGIIYAEN